MALRAHRQIRIKIKKHTHNSFRLRKRKNRLTDAAMGSVPLKKENPKNYAPSSKASICRVGYWRAAPVQSILAATAASILDPIRMLVARRSRAHHRPPSAVEGATPEAPPAGPAGGAFLRDLASLEHKK